MPVLLTVVGGDAGRMPPPNRWSPATSS